MRNPATTAHRADGGKLRILLASSLLFLVAPPPLTAAPKRAADLIDLVGMPPRPVDERPADLPRPPLAPAPRRLPTQERPVRMVVPSPVAVPAVTPNVPRPDTVPVQTPKAAAVPLPPPRPAEPDRSIPLAPPQQDEVIATPAAPTHEIAPAFQARMDQALPPRQEKPRKVDAPRPPVRPPQVETSDASPLPALRKVMAPSFTPAPVSPFASEPALPIVAPVTLAARSDDLLTPGTIPATRISYVVRTQPLDGVLREIGQLAGVSIAVGSGVRAEVRERRLDGTLERILDQLAREFGLFWFHDGMTIHVDPLDQQRTRAFRVKGGSRAGIARALEAAGLSKYRDRIQFNGSDGFVRVAGPDSFARAVEAALASSEPERTTISVIRAGMKGN